MCRFLATLAWCSPAGEKLTALLWYKLINIYTHILSTIVLTICVVYLYVCMYCMYYSICVEYTVNCPNLSILCRYLYVWVWSMCYAIIEYNVFVLPQPFFSPIIAEWGRIEHYQHWINVVDNREPVGIPAALSARTAGGIPDPRRQLTTGVVLYVA